MSRSHLGRTAAAHRRAAASSPNFLPCPSAPPAPLGVTPVPLGVTRAPFGVTPTPFGVTRAPFGVTPASLGVIPAKAGIQLLCPTR
jgi:hypothetical protein